MGEYKETSFIQKSIYFENEISKYLKSLNDNYISDIVGFNKSTIDVSFYDKRNIFAHSLFDGYIENKLYFGKEAELYSVDGFLKEKTYVSGKKIAVSIKYNLNYDTLMKVVSNYSSYSISDIVVICNECRFNDIQDKILSIKESFEKINVYVLIIKFNMHNLSDAYYDSNKNNKNLINEIKNLDNFVFSLGAGCSIKSKISDWKTLSESLGYDMIDGLFKSSESAYKRSRITSKINTEVFSNYDKTSAIDSLYSYFYKITGNKIDYYTHIKNVLYMYYDQNKDYDTKLMKAISACIIRKRIKKVINYNFDSVLEQSLNKMLYSTYYSSNKSEILSAKTMINNTEIYHVHGYIPYDYDCLTDVYSFIFNDSEYYNNMMDDMSYCNTIQEDIFLNENVIFIGCSFADANIKELLRKTKDRRIYKNIYTFLKIPSFKAAGNDMKMLKEDYIAIQNEYYNTLGVKVIWVDDYDEIPQIINTL